MCVFDSADLTDGFISCRWVLLELELELSRQNTRLAGLGLGALGCGQSRQADLGLDLNPFVTYQF